MQSSDAQNLCHGIDVSHYQHVDFTKLRDVDFMFIKATEGLRTVDTSFPINWAKAKTALVLRGAYHFFHADLDPILQARHFVQTMGPLSDNDLPPVLDIETFCDELPINAMLSAQVWLEFVEKTTGRVPILYSNAAFLEELKPTPAFAHYPLWLAAYKNPKPACPAPWTEFKFWQYSEEEPIEGVGNCDANWFFGSQSELTYFINQSKGK